MHEARGRVSPWLMLVVIALGAGVVSPLGAAEGLLDGKTFVGETAEKGSTKPDKDSLVFDTGQFRSAACDAYGFKPAAYKATEKDGVITFVADTTSAREGRMHWSGTVKGDSLEGTAVWTKPGQEDGHYSFKGTLKK